MAFPAAIAARPDHGDAVAAHEASRTAGMAGAFRSWRRLPAWLHRRSLLVILAVLLVLVNATLGLLVVRGLHHGYARVRDVDSAITAVAHLRGDVSELTHSAGVVLLLGTPGSLARYKAAQLDLSSEIDDLRRIIADRPEQQRRLDALRRWLNQQTAAIMAVTVRPSPVPDAVLLQEIAANEQRSDMAQRLVVELRQEEQVLQAARFDGAAHRLDEAFLISTARTLATVGLIGLMLLLIRRDRRLRLAMAMERAEELTDANRALLQEAAERRQAEQALRSGERVLRGLTDAMPQMVFVLHRDGTGSFINPRWHDYTGATERFVGEAGLECVHPDDVAAVTAQWREAVSTGAPFTAEFRLRGKDGCYRWFLAQSVPIAETDSDAARWVGALTDIDDLRRVDAVMRESEDRFRRIFEGSPFGITVSEGKERRILQANPAFCRMLGYTREELIGRSLLDVTHPDEQVVERAFPVLVGAGPGWHTREKRYITREGRALWARVRASVFETSGGVPNLLAVVEDISRQHELDEALRHAQRMEAVGQLSGGLAHDFNNLLGVIIGNVECLLEALAADPERAALARDILDSALNGAELTRRLLAFGRRQSLLPQQIHLSAQAARQVALLTRTLGREIRIETAFAADLWPVRADASQLGDALLNLAINARDAMPHGGVLTIETHNDTVLPDDAGGEADVVPGDYAVLSVSDTGVGMAPEVRARAVEPFFTTKPPGFGSGLGLSMIYGFVRQSGGHLTIASEVGIGTTVSICLPRVAAADEVGEPQTPREPGLQTGNENILVVDDSSEMRQVAERHLRFLGYSVVTAEHGPAALRLLRAGAAPDLLFTDIAMPEGLTGFQLAEAACAMRPGLKVLFTTGYAGMLDPAGADGWQARMIRKPYRRLELADKVRAALAS